MDYMNEQKQTTRDQSVEEFKKFHDKLFTSLLEQHGIRGRWEEFDGSTEGKALPGGLTSESGRILSEDGRVFAFWLDWDPEKIAPDGTKGWYTLGDKPLGKSGYTLFREIKPGDKLSVFPKPDDPSFLTARRRLSLPLDEEQLRILRDYYKDFSEMRKELYLDS